MIIKRRYIKNTQGYENFSPLESMDLGDYLAEFEDRYIWNYTPGGGFYTIGTKDKDIEYPNIGFMVFKKEKNIAMIVHNIDQGVLEEFEIDSLSDISAIISLSEQ